MATVSISEKINAPIETVFEVITDYESYPDFLPETKEVNVKSEDGNSKLVEFGIDIIKRFKYVLRMEENPPHEVSWVFEDGDLFRSNSGSWKLKQVGNSTEASYSLDIDFKIIVPGMIAKKLAGANLPTMMKNFKRRAEGLSK